MVGKGDGDRDGDPGVAFFFLQFRLSLPPSGFPFFAPSMQNHVCVLMTPLTPLIFPFYSFYFSKDDLYPTGDV